MSGTAVCPTCGAPVSAGARFCASCGSALAEQAPEERKLATILFADVIGSTDLGDQLDPERLRALLQDYFAAMAAIVDSWGGTIEKYIGDAILAVWGVPVAREDDPIRALNAAREMLAELERLNPEIEQRHGVRLGLRIGVNTGEVLAPVGAQPAGQFLVSGDAVNVAARLQQAAEPGSVLVGQRTWAGARQAFEFSEPIELEFKGKRAPVVGRLLGGPIDTSPGTEAARPLQAPMLGRERELNTLLGLLDEVVDASQPRLVLVGGPAGIGKSRMVRELIAASTQRWPDLLVLRGRCLATGHGITFWALGEVLRLVGGISLDEPADSAADKLERRVAGPLAAIGLAPEEMGRTVAALAMSANLPLTSNPLSDVDPEGVAEEMAQAWPRLLTGLARTQPVAVIIEDIHWADERMLRMLEAIATRSRGPLLILATARPEFLEQNAGFGAAADVSVVGLRALSDAQSRELVGELLGSADLPSALAEDIQHKADGNPFFLEEIVQRLIDEGALTNENGHWRSTERAGSVQLPDTIYALLAARIDALPADEKRLLQEAAVVGRTFWPGALGSGGVATDEVLLRAERRGLISLRPISTIENQSEYIFRHVLIRDVAYSSVPRKRRALAHAETGRWIEELARDRADEFGELIAFHLATAVSGDDADLGWAGNSAGREEVRRRAFDTLLRAGTSARRRFAVDKALELHEQALGLAATDMERAAAHEELGDDHEALFHGDDAVREYLAAVDLLPTPAQGAHRVAEANAASAEATAADPNVESRGRLAGKAGRMVLRWGTFHERPRLEQVQALVDESLASAVSEHTRANLLMVNGGLLPSAHGVPIATRRSPLRRDKSDKINQRIESISSGLDIARRLDDSELIYLGTDLLGIAYQTVGDYERMRLAAEEQAKIIDRLTSVRQQVDALVSVAIVRTGAGAYEAALDAADDAFRRSAGLSSHERMHVGYEILAASEPSGRWDRIAELMPWFAEAAAAEGDVTCASVRGGPPFGATVLARRGESERALAMVPIETDTRDEVTFVTAAHRANLASLVAAPEVARVTVGQALTHTSSGFFELGVVPMLEAMTRLQMYDDIASFLELARAQRGAAVTISPAIERAEAVLALARGDRATAEEKLRAALARFEELGTPFEIAQTQMLLAQVVEDSERADLLERAAAGFEALGAAPFVARAREAMSASEERLAR